MYLLFVVVVVVDDVRVGTFDKHFTQKENRVKRIMFNPGAGYYVCQTVWPTNEAYCDALGTLRLT